MNTIEHMLQESKDIGEFSKKYFDYIFKLLADIDEESLSAFIQQMEDARQSGNTIFFIGNGGSAATASHMVNDFGTGIGKKIQGAPPFRVVSLNDNSAVMLAVANDDGYDQIFINQLRVLYRPGDKLVAISASGNSPNLINAAEWVKEQGGVVISLVGFDGGKLKPISDVAIHVKSAKGDYGPVEDIHLILDHLLSYWAQYQILKQQMVGKAA